MTRHICVVQIKQKMNFKNSLYMLLTILILSCTKKTNNKVKTQQYAIDYHSYAQPNKAVATHLNLKLDVHFDTKIIDGVASYLITTQNNASAIVFDTKNLEILKVEANKKPTKFQLEKTDDILGRALKIELPKNAKTVTIYYKTTAKTEALQFLNPQQTADKKHPFLLTQGQAILTRTWIPIQDSPQIRITYNATVKVPNELMAVMSAKNPKQKSKDGVYHFEMKQPISPYLIALAVGDLAYKKISDRTGVYAEKTVIDKAHYEFADMEKMVTAAENLYGKYAWQQFDVVVLPPSFPFGGMENPRLTFATPTVIAGDRSLTSLIAHELAHSWSGNLVTNATWDDFWLNEGFTVYFEMRIMEALYGKDHANMLAAIGRQDLEEELQGMKNTPNDTKLKLNLKGRNPDDGMNSIAYDKGYLFLRTLENTVGRSKMDVFLKTYFNEHAFSTMTTERFIDYLNKNLLDKNDITFNVNEWIYKPGIPKNAITVKSTKFKDVENSINQWKNGKITAKEICNQDWNIQQKIHFIRNIPKEISKVKMNALDTHCSFTNSTNSYITMVWFEQAINHDYHANNVDSKIEDFLMHVGRRWYVSTIYSALKNNGEIKKAFAIYKKARPNYHSVTRNTIDEMLAYK